MECRNCGAELSRVFVDLGTSPLSNAYVEADDLDLPEPHFPLRPMICDACTLVQLPVFETPDHIFSEYAFFSGQSETWREHCAVFCARIVRRLRLNRTARVVEIASNDGTLVEQMLRWTPNVVGIEPAKNVAMHALKLGRPTINRFFGLALADELAADGFRADLVIANNVLAHVPDLDDFLRGIERLLAPGGAVSIEVPDVARLVAENQFDTIYHEHLSYFGVGTLVDALDRRGLCVESVEDVPTHGGSLRVLARRGERQYERCAPVGLCDYAARPVELKRRVVEMLVALRHEGRMIAGYGAPAKATTFLSYCGIGPDVIEFIVDSTPSKQGRYLPGARIPIVSPDVLQERQPDVIVILPWNWRGEILAKIERDCPWGPMVLCRDEVLRDGVLAAAA